jgi:hypothetical protein
MGEADRSLKRIISDYKDYIETTTKGPVVERAKVNDFGGIIVKEDQKVNTNREFRDTKKFYVNHHLSHHC